VNGFPALSSSTTPSASDAPVAHASSTPEPVRTLVLAGALADTHVAGARQMRLAAAAGLLQRFRAPRAQGASFEVTPQVWVHHPVLEVAVRSAHRIIEPRRHEDAERGDAPRVHVHEAEDFRLGIAERVENGAGLEFDVRRQIDDELHADGPIVLMVALGQAELFVELAADGTDGTVADDGERGADVHARIKPSAGWPFLSVP